MHQGIALYSQENAVKMVIGVITICTDHRNAEHNLCIALPNGNAKCELVAVLVLPFVYCDKLP